MTTLRHAMRVTIGVATLALVAAPALAQGIPVYDSSNYLQALATVQHTLKIVQQGAQAIQTAQTQLNALQQLTNVNGIASSLSSSVERNVLPGGTTDVTALLTGNVSQLGTLGTQAQAIHSTYAISSSGNATVDAQYNQLLAQVTAPAATKMALGQSLLATFQQRTSDLQSLQNALNTANDPKQTMDLSARISAEQAQLQNDMLKLQAIKMSEEAQATANSAISAALSSAASAVTFQNNILRP